MNFNEEVNFYIVGGAVRDTIINSHMRTKKLEIKDFDIVVENSSIEEMEANGFECINTRFPVFKHKDCDHEFALARRELKVSDGHGGFECDVNDVTIEEDLLRRDLTINAIAINFSLREILTENLGHELSLISKEALYIDPYKGIDDILNRRLRPVSSHFCEDPLRVVRAARFYAKLATDYQFTPTPALINACRNVEKSGELEYISGDRFWNEFCKLKNAEEINTYLDFLMKFDFGYIEPFKRMKRIQERNTYHPEDNVFVHTIMALRLLKDFNVYTVMGILLHDFGKIHTYEQFGTGHGHEQAGVPIIQEWCMKYGVPKKIREFCETVSYNHLLVHTCLGRNGTLISAEKIVELLEKKKVCENIEHLVDVCQADARGRGKTLDEVTSFREAPYPQGDFILNACKELRGVKRFQYFLGTGHIEALQELRKDLTTIVERKRSEYSEVAEQKKSGMIKAMLSLVLRVETTNPTFAMDMVSILTDTNCIKGKESDVDLLRSYMLKHELRYRDVKDELFLCLPFYSDVIKTKLGQL